MSAAGDGPATELRRRVRGSGRLPIGMGPAAHQPDVFATDIALIRVQWDHLEGGDTNKAGRAATAFVKRRIAGAERIVVRDPEWGKYGGRVIAGLVLDGRALSDLLIETGHGRPYAGGRRSGWCDERRDPR